MAVGGPWLEEDGSFEVCWGRHVRRVAYTRRVRLLACSMYMLCHNELGVPKKVLL